MVLQADAKLSAVAATIFCCSSESWSFTTSVSNCFTPTKNSQIWLYRKLLQIKDATLFILVAIPPPLITSNSGRIFVFRVRASLRHFWWVCVSRCCTFTQHYTQVRSPYYCRAVAENAAKGYSIKTGPSGTKRDLQFAFWPSSCREAIGIGVLSFSSCWTSQ